jgi:hypothetical protein
MPDLLDRIRKELNARLRELRPVMREFERLERAGAALARSGARSVPAPRSRAAPTAAERAAAAGARPKRGAGPAEARRAPRGPARPQRGAGSRRKAAPRGQTQAKVLKALDAAPGSGPAAVATESGVSTGVAAATLSRLVKQGRARRLGAGRYAIVDAASAAGPSEDAAAAQPTRAPPPPTPG